MASHDQFPVIQDEVLRDIDNYIATKCKKPDAPYYPIGEGVNLTIREVREQIAQGTDIGREAAESWRLMREAEKNVAAKEK